MKKRTFDAGYLFHFMVVISSVITLNKELYKSDINDKLQLAEAVEGQQKSDADR